MFLIFLLRKQSAFHIFFILKLVSKSEQGVFEGTKAYRREDGRLCLFRPDQNAIRMQVGADRMCMPSPSLHQFVEAVKQTALSNKRWVIISNPCCIRNSVSSPNNHFFDFDVEQIPPPGKGSLYMRPLLMGSGPILGLGPAPEYTFLVYASPVGNYFKVGLLFYQSLATK